MTADLRDEAVPVDATDMSDCGLEHDEMLVILQGCAQSTCTMLDLSENNPDVDDLIAYANILRGFNKEFTLDITMYGGIPGAKIVEFNQALPENERIRNLHTEEDFMEVYGDEDDVEFILSNGTKLIL